MIRAVIFDMDGVLLDTERMIAAAWMQAAKELKIPLSEEVVLSTCGRNDRDTRTIISAFLTSPSDYDVLLRRQEHLTELAKREHGIPVKPFIPEALAYLRENRYPLAVASSSSRSLVMENLQNSGLSCYFDAFVCGDMVMHGKPDPEPFIRAAEELGVPPECCAVVEDASAGVLAARRANMFVIMIPDILAPTELDRKLLNLCLDSAAKLPELFPPKAN